MIFRKAILIVHGFAGGTYDEEELANFLELNPFYDVFQFTLPGHKTNLSKVKYEQWIDASKNQIEWLIENGYKNIYVIGHSMGGVIATYLAATYKEVKKLILAAPAFQYLIMENEKINVTKSLKSTPSIVKTYGIEEIFGRILKLNPSAVKEFMNLVKEYYNCPKDVFCPILIIQGKKDNIVRASSSKYVYNSVKSKIKKIVYVNDLTHDVFYSKRSNEIYNIILKFLKNSESGEFTI